MRPRTTANVTSPQPRQSGSARRTAMLVATCLSVVPVAVAFPGTVSATEMPAAVVGPGGSVSCTSDIAEFGPLHVSQEMAAGTNGFLQLGWPTPSSKNHFIGTCDLSGTIPAGWTVAVAPFANLSALAGTGNAGTLEFDTDDTTFSDGGPFLNSGKVVDNSSGFTQGIEVGSFVNTGSVVSNSPNFATVGKADAPTCTPCTFVDRGSVQVSPKDTFTSGSNFVLEPGASIGAAGTFNIANLSTFDMQGGSVTGGMLATSQFLGRGPATIEFGSPLPASSEGAIDVSTSVNLEGVVPQHWTIVNTGGSIDANGSGNAGTFIWKDVDDSTFSDNGTFVNSGTFSDDATGFTQQVAVGKFVNTGTVTSDAPGFGTDGKAEDTTCTPCAFINQGTVEVDAKAIFSSGGTFILEPGGTIDAAGNFSIANLSAFDVDGGSVAGGPLTTAQFLGRGPAALDFADGLGPVSIGKIDISTGVDLQGSVPKRWLLDVDGGSITAAGSASNNGTLEWDSGGQLTASGTFTNTGTLEDTGGYMKLTTPDFVNAPGAHLVATGPNYFIFLTGNLSNHGSLQLGPTSRAVISGDFTQNADGSLGISIAGGSEFGLVQVSAQADLAGALDIDKMSSYAAHVGDSQEVITAKAVSGTFRDVSGTSDGPHLGSAISYSAQSVTLKVERAA